MLPEGWKERLIPVRNANTRGATGLCLEIHDLLISKYVAGREKDRRFARAAARHRLADRTMLLQRLKSTQLDDARREPIAAFTADDFRHS